MVATGGSLFHPPPLKSGEAPEVSPLDFFPHLWYIEKTLAMRLSVVGVLSLLWIVGSSSINSNQASLQVTCSEPQGCFGLLGKALAAAPTGSTISIGPGIFYERPLVIDKSFVLQGAGADLTKIRIVEPGSAITIRSAELVEVMIASLAIAVPFVWDERRIGTGVVWVQQSDKTQT
jgi:hypothetical protein